MNIWIHLFLIVVPFMIFLFADHWICFVAAIICLSFVVYLFCRCKNTWDTVFCASCTLCLLYLAVPKLLNFHFVYNLVDAFFKSLQYIEYKSTFVEAVGSLLGTATAIFGALWADNFLEQAREQEEDAKNARVIYYDLKIIFGQLQKIMEDSSVNNSSNKVMNPIFFGNYNLFAGTIHNYRILFDEHWIRTVASLPDSSFDTDLREHIYILYDHLCRIKHALDRCPVSYIDNSHIDEYCTAYSEIFDLVMIAPDEYRPDFSNESLKDSQKKSREKTEKVWSELKRMVGVKKHQFPN